MGVVIIKLITMNLWEKIGVGIAVVVVVGLIAWKYTGQDITGSQASSSITPSAEQAEKQSPESTTLEVPTVYQRGQKVSITGQLGMVVADNFDQETAEYLFEVVSDTNSIDRKTFSREHISSMASGVQLGERVSVAGISDGQGGLTSVKVSRAADSPITISSAVLAASSRRRWPVAVIPIVFSNTPSVSEDLNRASLYSFLFRKPYSASKYYQEVSSSLLNMAGYTYDPVVIPHKEEGCRPFDLWGPAALQIVEQRHGKSFLVDSFSSIVFLIYERGGGPSLLSCQWGGMATVGGYVTPAGDRMPSWAFVRVRPDTITDSELYHGGSIPGMMISFIHELGHNLGRGHASSYTCYGNRGERVAISSNCVVHEYGDYFDVMGNSRVQNTDNGEYWWEERHFNASWKAGMLPFDFYHPELELVWLSSDQIQYVTKSGVYRLAPQVYNNHSGGPGDARVLRIVTGEDEYYDIEWRIKYGLDQWFGLDRDTPRGVLIRLGKKDSQYTGPQLSQTFLIDTTPGSIEDKGFGWDMGDAALLEGRTFRDPIRGITITPLSTKGLAKVQIQLSQE